MERELIVHLDADSGPIAVGRLWSRERTGRETSSFTYDPSWLRRRGAFALAPSLALGPGPHHSARALPGMALAFNHADLEAAVAGRRRGARHRR